MLKQSSDDTRGADVDDGVRPGGRWHDLTMRGGLLIVGSSRVCALQGFAGRWHAHLAPMIAPVIGDHESAGIPAAIVAEHGA